jgi:hypothetical protein
MTIVFLGPTLEPGQAAGVLADAEMWPPVARGDVLRACKAGARRIAIVDGYFDQVPSVMHKEILYAIERGVAVFGSSSMGALRAAELDSFGMTGVGRIYAMYRDGVLEDDDEVAIAHGAAETGYRSISDAMVDIRDRIEAAVASALVEPDDAARAIAYAKSLPYPARSFRTVAGWALDGGLRSGAAERFAAFVTEAHPTLKQRDALALLERLASGAPAPAETPARVERTVFFERLRLTVEHEEHDADDFDHDSPPDDGDVLLGLLAEEYAGLLLQPLASDELALMIHDLRAAHGVGSPEDFERRLRERGTSMDELAARLRELAAIRRLARLYGPEIERRRLARIRLADLLESSDERAPTSPTETRRRRRPAPGR